MDFVNACLNKPTKRTPIWLMRQAGRYQSIYRDLRAKHDLLTLVKTPELACEVTMQPINSFDLDAAIIFSDILPLLEGMGLKLEFLKGEGPVIHNPISSRQDIENLREVTAEESMPFTLEAIRLVRKELAGINVDSALSANPAARDLNAVACPGPRAGGMTAIPLVGFSGSPFTLASYAIEGGSSKNYIKTKKLMYSDPEAFDLLMRKLSNAISDYLIKQAESGAQVLQLFDSWAGALSPSDYAQYVMPHIESILAQVKATLVTKNTPILYFSTGTSSYLNLIKNYKCDGLSVDWRIDIAEAIKIIGPEKSIQGNLDPVSLFAPWPVLKLKAKHIIDSVKTIRPDLNGFIFNLGHGILPETPEDNVKKLVDFVHEYN